MSKPGGKSWRTYGRSYWPTLETADDAKKAVREAAALAVICGVGLVANATLTHRYAGCADAAGFLILAFFIFRFSRAAATIGLLFFALEVAWSVATVGRNFPPIFVLVAIVFTLGYANGTRGAFAWHRFRASSTPQPARESIGPN
ncbi:MAG: hypothetical protein WA005_14230 [Candidatus Binataceae bacterium]